MDLIADGLGAELDSDRGWESLFEKLSFKDDSTAKEFGKIAKTPSPQATFCGG